MPAPKAHRQSVKRYARNMSVRRATRTAVGRARRALSVAAPESEDAVRNAMSMLDIAVRQGRAAPEQRLPPQSPPRRRPQPDPRHPVASLPDAPMAAMAPAFHRRSYGSRMNG